MGEKLDIEGVVLSTTKISPGILYVSIESDDGKKYLTFKRFKRLSDEGMRQIEKAMDGKRVRVSLDKDPRALFDRAISDYKIIKENDC